MYSRDPLKFNKNIKKDPLLKTAFNRTAIYIVLINAFNVNKQNALKISIWHIF